MSINHVFFRQKLTKMSMAVLFVKSVFPFFFFKLCMCESRWHDKSMMINIINYRCVTPIPNTPDCMSEEVEINIYSNLLNKCWEKCITYILMERWKYEFGFLNIKWWLFTSKHGCFCLQLSLATFHCRHKRASFSTSSGAEDKGWCEVQGFRARGVGSSRIERFNMWAPWNLKDRKQIYEMWGDRQWPSSQWKRTIPLKKGHEFDPGNSCEAR